MAGQGITGTAAHCVAVLGAFLIGAVPAAARRFAARQHTVRSRIRLPQATPERPQPGTP